MASCRSISCDIETKLIWIWAIDNNNWITATHIPGINWIYLFVNIILFHLAWINYICQIYLNKNISQLYRLLLRTEIG